MDQRNLDGDYHPDDAVYDSIPCLYNSDGSPLPRDKFEGSTYLRFDHALSKMVVDKDLRGEKDSDSPLVVYDFLTHALEDCVAKGAEEYFLIFSSHGGGFKGLGGDDNLPQVLRKQAKGTPMDNPDNTRKLTIGNQKLVNAITQALRSTEGAPDKLDVLGFDACYMSALGALDEYRDVTKYYLASEGM